MKFLPPDNMLCGEGAAMDGEKKGPWERVGGVAAH